MHSNDFRRISEAHCKFVSISSWVLILPLKFYEKSADSTTEPAMPKGVECGEFHSCGNESENNSNNTNGNIKHGIQIEQNHYLYP